MHRSVEVLLRRYAGCLGNQEDAVNRRLEHALGDIPAEPDEDTPRTGLTDDLIRSGDSGMSPGIIASLRTGFVIRRRDHPGNHLVPFQRRISVRSVSDEVEHFVQDQPAAQAVPPGPVLTLERRANWPELGLGTGDQVVPSQRRISVRSVCDEVPHRDAQ